MDKCELKSLKGHYCHLTEIIHSGLPQNQQPIGFNTLHLCFRRPSKIELKIPSKWTKCSSCHLYCVTVIHQGIKVKAALLVITESFEMICGEENRRLRECSKWLDLRPIFASICLTDRRIKALYRMFFFLTYVASHGSVWCSINKEN